MADYIIPRIDVVGKKIPVETTEISNPMHQFASWTYSWSLWWLSIDDHNALMNRSDVDTAMSWEPGPTSYVIAEDGGVYLDRRYPGARKLNYNIQSVDFETIVGPNSTTRHTNLVNGHVTILEPYGVTFIDLLINMSKNATTGKFQAYTQQPYMLECNFVGYDNDGNPVPQNRGVYRKRFPIKILTMDIEVGKGGSSYTCEFCATGAIGHYPELATTPATFTITAGTVEEFFNGGTTGSDNTIVPGVGLAYYLNQFYRNELQKPNSTVGAAEFVDQYRFIIDSSIATSTIADPTKTNLLNSAPGSKIVQDKNTFKIPAKSSIIDIVTRIMSQSSYFIKLQNINVKSAGATGTGTDILNLFKTTLSTKYAGANKAGDIVENVYDTKRQYYPLLLTYNIGQYYSFDGKHPATNSQVTELDKFVIKRYAYLYTGQNLDILDFKLNFNSTYYTAVMAYQTPVAAAKPSPSTAAESAAVSAGPALGFNIMLFNDFKNLTPPRTRGVKVVQGVTAGGLIEKPDAIVVSDVLKSVYTDLSGGDQVALDLTIVGDPTLIKQDDWLYIPNPQGSRVYNSWDTADKNQYNFAQRYGHIRMDSGELVIYITVNSPIDIDDGSDDYPDTGLMFPAMDGTNTYTSLFSGYYKIITIKSTFQNGKFEQVLSMVRYTQSDYLRRVIPNQRIQGYTAPPGAVGQAQVNGTNTSAPNGYIR
jgi:hypothetical protein